jgi:hypothetical protein
LFFASVIRREITGGAKRAKQKPTIKLWSGVTPKAMSPVLATPIVTEPVTM